MIGKIVKDGTSRSHVTAKKRDNLFRDCPLMTDDAFLALSLGTSATLAYFTSTIFLDAMNLLLASTDSENTRTR
jgi:hypothetical protein